MVFVHCRVCFKLRLEVDHQVTLKVPVTWVMAVHCRKVGVHKCSPATKSPTVLMEEESDTV